MCYGANRRASAPFRFVLAGPGLGAGGGGTSCGTPSLVAQLLLKQGMANWTGIEAIDHRAPWELAPPGSRPKFRFQWPPLRRATRSVVCLSGISSSLTWQVGDACAASASCGCSGVGWQATSQRTASTC